MRLSERCEEPVIETQDILAAGKIVTVIAVPNAALKDAMYRFPTSGQGVVAGRGPKSVFARLVADDHIVEGVAVPATALPVSVRFSTLFLSV